MELCREALDADLHVVATRDAAVLEAWMRARLADYATIVVVGGDGSLGVAFNAVAGRDVTLGYVPAGFGNATAHLLRLPRQPEQLAALMASGESRPIDLMAVGERLALFAGAGWDARVARRYADEGAHLLFGWARAVAESVPDLLHRPSVRVTADGELVHEGPMELLVVGTTPFYGRGLKVNPGARPDIGRLTVRVYPGPAPRLAFEAVRWVAGRRPRAVGHRALSVSVQTLDGRPLAVQADGDALGESSSWRFDVRPRAVRLIGRW